MGKEKESGVSGRKKIIDRFAEYAKDIRIPGAPPYNLPQEMFPYGLDQEDDKLYVSKENNRQDNVEEEIVNYDKKLNKKEDYEPFVNQPEQEEKNLFVNNYSGAFAQRMELNRPRVERVLQIAHLDGKVSLSSMPASRSRGEVQGDTLAAKRFVIFERRKKGVEEENPYKRVVSTPEGWNIQINDQKMIDELQERRLSQEEQQKVFVNEFNRFVKSGIRESVLREKLSSEKNVHFKKGLAYDSFIIGMNSIPYVFSGGINLIGALDVAGSSMAVFGLVNLATRKRGQIRHIDSKWEYLMPDTEIDKVIRTNFYLAGRGRNVVRETSQ